MQCSLTKEPKHTPHPNLKNVISNQKDYEGNQSFTYTCNEFYVRIFHSLKHVAQDYL